MLASFENINNSYELFFCKLSLFTIIVISYLCREYGYTLNKGSYLITWTVGIILVIPFILANDFIILFISLIGFSLAVYTFLLSDYTRHTVREAGIKYYYLSTFSSSLLLYATFMVYLIFHSCNFDEVYVGILQLLLSPSITASKWYSSLFLLLTFFILGFSFKLSAFPGHLWAPEIYEGAPNMMFGFFILPSKVIMLTAFIKVITHVFGSLFFLWQPIIFICCAGSLIFGAIGAIYERKIKRFLAYTSINQMGFLLIGIVTGTISGVVITLVYLIIYIALNINFLSIFLRLNNCIYLTDLSAIFKTSNLLSLTLVFTIFSMAGIPPLAGFFGKFYLLIIAFKASCFAIVKIALISSVITAYYYIRVIRLIYFNTTTNMTTNNTKAFEVNGTVPILLIASSQVVMWTFPLYGNELITLFTFLLLN